MKLNTLKVALIVSVAIHAVLLTMRFVDPEGFNRVFQDTPLEVILVNAKSNERPQKAQAIAQSSLAGGGDADKGRATSPLPSAAFTDPGESLDEAQNKVESLQALQTTLLAQTKQALFNLPAPDLKQPGAQTADAQREEKRKQLIKLLAEIEKQINDQNARPKKRYISPATSEEVYAIYYDALRHKIEDKGTANFPQAGGQKLYGELTMLVTVNFDGQVLDTEVVQSSGKPQLDRQALAIARSAGPFGRFSEAMRKRADQLVLVSRFKFNRDETLETKLVKN